MLSGVGDTEHLRQVGVEPIHHLPGVGQNLQDHLDVYLVSACTKPVSLYKEQKGLRMLRTGIQWFLDRSGPASSSNIETGGFIRSGPHVAHPNLQFHFVPSQVRDHGRLPPTQEAFQGGGILCSKMWKLKCLSTVQSMVSFCCKILTPGYKAHVDQLRPTSRGTIKLASSDPRQHPLIDPNYLDTEHDRLGKIYS